MKYYHDTNSVIQIKNFTNGQIRASYTSFLAVMELISGISSEQSFFRRKGVLKAIHGSGIEIVWKTVGSILAESVGIPCESCDSDATKLMMEAILDCDSYAKLLEVKFTCCDREYDIRFFSNYDSSFSENLVDETIYQSNTIDSSGRKKISAAISGEYSMSYLQSSHEMKISQIALHLLPKGTNKNSDAYIQCMEFYQANPRLRDYLFCIDYGLHAALSGGGTVGKNDAFDYSHIIYTCFGGHLVSDDHFFRRIPKTLCKIRFLSVNEFKEETAML